MSRRRFDKKNAQTFSVVHRAHDDEHYFDNEASQHVLVPVKGGNARKSTTSSTKLFTAEQIADEMKEKVRANEGMAAQYGIYYDDSKYDYMQHLKPIGKGDDAVFVAATPSSGNQKVPTKKANIEQLFEGQLPSKTKRHVSSKDMQDIPDELKGFNPNMDPRLREVLEALDDDAYLERRDDKGEDYEDNDEDLFADLLASGEVYDDEDDEYYDDGGEYDEWDLDNYDEGDFDRYEDGDYVEEEGEYEFENPYNEGEAPEDEVPVRGGGGGRLFAPEGMPNNMATRGWEKDFMKYKKAANSKDQNDWDSDDDFDEEGDALADLPQLGAKIDANGSKKLKTKIRKKKGALTDVSGFSMLSSALFRTEGLTLLDDQYDQLQKKQEEEDEKEEKYEQFDMMKERGDFEEMLDDFLDNYELEKGGRRLAKKDAEKKRIQEAADLVSKSKVAARRKKESKESLGGLGKSFGGMKIN